MFIAVGILITINLTVKEQRIAPHGFTRFYLQDTPILRAKADLTGDWNMIAGINEGRIFIFGKIPGEFRVLDSNLKISKTIEIAIPGKLRENIGKAFSINVDENIVHIFASNIPAIFSTNLKSRESRLLILPPGSFSHIAMTDSGEFFLRKYNPVNHDISFYRLDCRHNRLNLLKDITPLFHDIGFTTDGQLHWDKLTRRLVYNYFYSNGWMSLNREFSNLRVFHSIDTFSQFQVKTIRQGEYITTLGDPKPVNAFSTTDSGVLYVRSTVRADNETMENFENGSTIDTYDILSGRYIGSLRLPNLNGKAVRSFRVYHCILYVIYPSGIEAFKIPNFR